MIRFADNFSEEKNENEKAVKRINDIVKGHIERVYLSYDEDGNGTLEENNRKLESLVCSYFPKGMNVKEAMRLFDTLLMLIKDKNNHYIASDIRGEKPGDYLYMEYVLASILSKEKERVEEVIELDTLFENFFWEEDYMLLDEYSYETLVSRGVTGVAGIA